jgi:YVTN family beta-propeller protein
MTRERRARPGQTVCGEASTGATVARGKLGPLEPGQRLDYRILGPLEVCRDGSAVELAGEKLRVLLALLLLHANEVVSADALIDGLWGERPPTSAPNALHVHVSRLRRALEDGAAPSPPPRGVLDTQGHGYVLRVAAGELDVDCFRERLAQGREALTDGKPEEAARILRGALGLWRGAPLADFVYEPFAQAAIAQLEELRLAALEDRIEADLELGLDRELVGELSAVVERNPLRERLRGQLMLALYRGGRQAEALRAYQEYRRGLSEQLGLEPSPVLRELEASILGRDPSLELANEDQGGADRIGSLDASAKARPIDHRGRKLALVGSFVLVVAIIGAVVASSGGAGLPAVIAGDSVGAIGPSSGAIRALVPLGRSPTSLAAGDGSVWVTNYDAGTVMRINPATRAVVQMIPVGSAPSGIATGAGAVWVVDNWGNTVFRIDPTIDRVVQPIPVGNAPSGVAVGFGSVWVTNDSDRTLSRINALTGAVTDTIPLGTGTSEVTTGLGAVWVSDAVDGRVLRVDPGTNQVTQSIAVGAGADAIATGYGSVWVANGLDGTVSRIDPATGSVTATIPVGEGPAAIAMAAGAVWVANQFAGTVVGIDPTRNAVVRTIRVGNRPSSLVVADGSLWVGSQPQATSHRGGTLRTLMHSFPGTADPATSPGGFLLTYTNDGLTAFERTGGPQSARVVPDLAVSLPSPTDGGTTYTFQLRRGIRYSNGQPVRTEDFRLALERQIVLGPNFYYGGIPFANVIGAAACAADPRHCDLSHGVTTDDAADTVTFHLVAPDPELIDKLALPDAVAVPAGTPMHDVGDHPTPATGPYEFASYNQHEIKLVRNPNFHVWSPAARPDGYPDQILIQIGASPSAELTAVEENSADYTFDSVPANRLSEVQTRFVSQLRPDPNDVTDMLVLNTRVAPFNDIRVRRAINYAIDRDKIARLLGFDSTPTCQTLAPTIAGFRRYCPYTANPTPNTGWHAPNLALAEQLVATSRTRGTPITIYDGGTLQANDNPAGQYLASVLDRLGYPTHWASGVEPQPRFADSRDMQQALLTVLIPNYPSASQMVQPDLSCEAFVQDSPANGNFSEYCDHELDALTARALAAEGQNSPAATQLWAQADRFITHQAVTVPLVTPGWLDFVSDRVGNYQYSFQYGPLLDQLWVR